MRTRQIVRTIASGVSEVSAKGTQWWVRILAPVVLGLSSLVPSQVAAQAGGGSDLDTRHTGERPALAPADALRPFSAVVRRPLIEYRALSDGLGAHVDQTLRVELGAPISVGESTVVLIGGYRWHQLGSASLPSDSTTNLHRFFAGAVGILRLTDHWALDVIGGLIYASDLSSYRSEAWAALASINAVWQVSPRWALTAGATLVRIGDTYVPIPSLGALYRTRDSRFAIDIVLPRSAEIRGRVARSWELFAQATFEALGWWTEDDVELTLFEVRTAAGLRWRFTDRFYSEVAVGLMPFRRGVRRENDVDQTTNTAPAASLDLTIGVKLDGR
ncbi:MAG: DUF6268 family outer membrane beta-barrel protein [Myxococcota bacterium]